jgi:hypothetical protein
VYRNGLCSRYFRYNLCQEFLQANPGKRAAVIAVESPQPPQLNDYSMANIVSAAIFVMELHALYYLSSHDNGPKFSRRDVSFFNNEHMMGFKLTIQLADGFEYRSTR